MTPKDSNTTEPRSKEDSAPNAPGTRPDQPESPGGKSTPSAALFTFPTRIQFGPGSRNLLPAELNRLGMARPLIVTDPGLVDSGLVTAVIAPLGNSCVIYSAVKANPDEADVLSGLSHYLDAGCDGLVAVGGGSPIDAAKAIRLLVTHAGQLADYDLTRGGQDRIRPDMPPLVAIPTTAGTGSEAGRGALIQLPQTGRKTIVLSQHLLPSAVICDPELTYKLPPVLTAGTGMDAYTHCVESFLSTTFHPICDGIAVEGLRSIQSNLETVVRDGLNVEARSEMMMGALLGGISFHKGLGVVHSLSHALGSEGRVHHGTLNAILLPHALRFNRDVATERMAELASRLGLGNSVDSVEKLITLTELILTRLPLPTRLAEVGGLRHDQISEYARLAMIDHCHRTNPRRCTQPDLEDLLDRAW